MARAGRTLSPDARARARAAPRAEPGADPEAREGEQALRSAAWHGGRRGVAFGGVVALESAG